MTAIPPLLQFASSFQVSQQGGMTAGEEASSKARFLRVYFRRSMPHTTAAIPDPRRAKPKTPPFPQPRTREPSDRIRGILSWDFWAGLWQAGASDFAGSHFGSSRRSASRPPTGRISACCLEPGEIKAAPLPARRCDSTCYMHGTGRNHILRHRPWTR